MLRVQGPSGPREKTMSDTATANVRTIKAQLQRQKRYTTVVIGGDHLDEKTGLPKKAENGDTLLKGHLVMLQDNRPGGYGREIIVHEEERPIMGPSGGKSGGEAVVKKVKAQAQAFGFVIRWEADENGDVQKVKVRVSELLTENLNVLKSLGDYAAAILEIAMEEGVAAEDLFPQFSIQAAQEAAEAEPVKTVTRRGRKTKPGEESTPANGA